MAIPQYPGSFSAKTLEPPGCFPDGFVLLDIREVNEWEAGHAPGSVNYPYSQMQTSFDGLPDGNIVVTCRTGSRSAAATEFLALKGHRVWNMRDGMLAWRLAGNPVVREDGSPGHII